MGYTLKAVNGNVAYIARMDNGMTVGNDAPYKEVVSFLTANKPFKDDMYPDYPIAVDLPSITYHFAGEWQDEPQEKSIFDEERLPFSDAGDDNE